VTEQDSNNQAKPPVAKESKPATPAKVANHLWLIAVALLLALLAIAASGYLWHSGQQQQRQILADLGGAQQLIKTQQSQLTELQRELSQQSVLAKQQQQVLQSSLQQLQQQLQSQQKRLLSLSTTDREDWLLAEVEYLLRLAEQRIMTARDAVSAIGLLEAADHIVVELDDSALYPLRKTLAENRVALQVAAKLDVEGLYLQLQALAKEVHALPLFPSEYKVADAGDEQPEPQGWQQRVEQTMHNAWQKLDKYVRVSTRDTAYQPALAIDEEAALRHSVQSMFEQAQMALLAGNSSLYQKSLEKAQLWLHNFYSLQPELTEVIIAKLDELKSQPVTAELPDISSSRRVLKDYIDGLHQIPAGTEQAEEATP
jgi:uroporphyrin-3 C-methyltransferase